MPVLTTSSRAVARPIRTSVQKASAAFPVSPRSRSVPPIRSIEGPKDSCRSAFARARTSDIWEEEVGRVYQVDYYSTEVDTMNAEQKTTQTAGCCCCGGCCSCCGCCTIAAVAAKVSGVCCCKLLSKDWSAHA